MSEPPPQPKFRQMVHVRTVYERSDDDGETWTECAELDVPGAEERRRTYEQWKEAFRKAMGEAR